MLPVQYVARGSRGIGEQARTYWGRIAQGAAAVGDEVQTFPGSERARIVSLRHAGRTVHRVPAGQSAGVVLDRQVDVSRGSWLGAVGALHEVRRFEATLAWLDNEAAQPHRRYWVRHAHCWVAARIERIEHRLDIRTLEPEAAHELGVNQIGRVVVQLQQPLPLHRYCDSRVGGSLIVVDPTSHRTSGALLVEAIETAGH
jgi:sulfate adenylyltransferase subunit 1